MFGAAIKKSCGPIKLPHIPHIAARKQRRAPICTTTFLRTITVLTCRVHIFFFFLLFSQQPHIKARPPRLLRGDIGGHANCAYGWPIVDIRYKHERAPLLACGGKKHFSRYGCPLTLPNADMAGHCL